MAAAGAPMNLLPWLLVLISLTFASSSSPARRIPRLGVHRTADSASDNEKLKLYYASEGYETQYYNQTLDHFNYQKQSYATFRQKYVVNSRYWRGAPASSPIFAYLGEESALDSDIVAIGFLRDNAARFGALLVYIEHRFYGESVPFVSREEALKNTTLRGYFNSAQALADYAEVLLHVKKNLSADSSPVIVFGGSYGGMLAAWFRLKYPHVALGALASSAPVLYFDNIVPSNGYYSIVTKDFKEASEFCYRAIKQSWAEIDRVAAKPHGLSVLNKKFNPCKPLKSADDLKDALDSLYSSAAQYDHPPRYPVNVVCDGITKASKSKGSRHLLDIVAAGVSAYFGNRTCNDFDSFFPLETLQGWDWQVCSEIVMPIGRRNDTMFPASPFNLTEFEDDCKETFGVTPRPHWVTTYYGGHNITEVLRRFGSNIIFSNGLRDPYSSGGVLRSISDSVVAVYTKHGSHCLDILPGREDDPDWLVSQRNVEIEIISGWILQYYQDLLQNTVVV